MAADLILSLRLRASAKTGLYMDYKGWRFFAPFYCMRCGVAVEPQQFAFSRSCGGCDVSESRTARLNVFDPRLFAGVHVLINPRDKSFLEPERFLSPEEAKNFPVLNPMRKPVFWELFGGKNG